MFKKIAAALIIIMCIGNTGLSQQGTPQKVKKNYYVVPSDEAYQKALPKLAKRQVVYYFGAKWCGPCQQQGPIFEEIASQFLNESPPIYFLKIDVDNCPEATKINEVRALPTIFIKDRSNKFVGLQSKEALTSSIKRIFKK